MDEIVISNIPYADFVKNIRVSNLESGRSNSPSVSLPQDMGMTIVDPRTSDKTYEIVRNIYYDTRSLPPNSDLTVVVSKGKIPITLASATLTYAEVSATYLGSDGKYYPGLFTEPCSAGVDWRFRGPRRPLSGALSWVWRWLAE